MTMSWTPEQAIRELLELPSDIKKIISFSGGKDSTALLALVIKATSLGFKNWEVVHSNTLMEFPFMDAHVMKCKEEVEALGFVFKYVVAPIEKRFFYTLIGKGIPSPMRNFRWCTQALKLDPMANAAKGETEYITINGERLGESSKRDQKLKAEKSCSDGTNECGVSDQKKKRKNIFPNAVMFVRPLLEASTCNVWDWLAIADIEHGILSGSFERLNNIYSISDQDSGDSLRTGCIGCTLITKDRSLAKLVGVYPGYEALEKLRGIYDKTRIDDKRIMRPDMKGKGAVDLEWRKQLWKEILEVESEVQQHYPDFVLIYPDEKEAVEEALRKEQYPKGYTKSHVASQTTKNIKTTTVIPKPRKPMALTLFAGIGGSSLGLAQAGFDTYSIELDPDAANMHRVNLGECQCADVLDINPMHIKYTIDVPSIIWLSPPCQAYSKSGMGKTKGRADANILTALIDNEWFSTLPAPYIVLENVPEYRKSPCFANWCQHVIEQGYQVAYDILDANDFGVPTRRKRLFAIATLSTMPTVTIPYTKTSWLDTIRHLISDMPDSELTEGQAEYLAENPVNSDEPFLIERTGYYNNKPKVALSCDPLWTLRKSIGTDSKGSNRSKFINVVLPDGTVKDLSVQGLAMLQGFPEDYKWGSVGASVSGIGNAVCPPLAKAIGTGVMQELVNNVRELVA